MLSLLILLLFCPCFGGFFVLFCFFYFMLKHLLQNTPSRYNKEHVSTVKKITDTEISGETRDS